MLWICRAGQDAVFYSRYLSESIIALPWNGYRFDLSELNSMEACRSIVAKEKTTTNRTSISNWSAQLFAFCHEMQIGDYVLIPGYHGRSYSFAEIVSNYYFCNDDEELCHKRKIKILKEDIGKEFFSQSEQYSLGAYRTVFKPRYGENIINSICGCDMKK